MNNKMQNIIIKLQPASSLIYIFVGNQLLKTVTPNGEVESHILVLLPAVALLSIVLSFILDKITSKEKIFKKIEDEGVSFPDFARTDKTIVITEEKFNQLGEFEQKALYFNTNYFRNTLVRSATIEFCGIQGLVLTILTGNFQYVLALALTSLVFKMHVVKCYLNGLDEFDKRFNN
jgi:hypothetical protein